MAAPSTPPTKPLPRHLKSALAALAEPDRLWEAVRHPLRGVDVRAWLKKRPEWFLMARGDEGETPLHWAVMADYGLVLEEVATGLDPNAHDNHGRTPLDWLTDRLVAGTVLEPYRLPAMGRAQLLAASEEAGLVLWAQGGRPGQGPASLHAGRAWMSAGAWALVNMWDTMGPQAWDNWTSAGAGALHHWGVAPEGPGKDTWLSAYRRLHPDMDPTDQAGRTPLWYLADAMQARPQHRARLDAAWQTLVEAGADPERTAQDGSSPAVLRALLDSP